VLKATVKVRTKLP